MKEIAEYWPRYVFPVSPGFQSDCCSAERMYSEWSCIVDHIHDLLPPKPGFKGILDLPNCRFNPITYDDSCAARGKRCGIETFLVNSWRTSTPDCLKQCGEITLRIVEYSEKVELYW